MPAGNKGTVPCAPAASGWTDKLTQVTKTFLLGGVPYDAIEAVTYDGVGNVLTYGNKSYTWENGRNLTAITEGNNTYSYTYDEEGVRTSKTVGGTTTYFNYDNGQLLSQSDGTNTFIFQYDASGNLAGFIYNGTQYFYITNTTGDVIGFVDSQNNFGAMYYYIDAAWGSYIEIDAATNAMRALANLNPFRYKGYYYDAETGYYYLQSRYYDPEICRFINADDVEMIQLSKNETASVVLFVYCNNDPVNKIDKSGYWFGSGHSITQFSNGFSVMVHPDFIEKYYCKNFALGIIGKYGNGKKFKGMTRDRIAIEIWAHTFVYYFLDYFKDSKLKNKLKQRTKKIDVNKGDYLFPLYYSVWLCVDMHVKEIVTNPKATSSIKKLAKKAK
ncbi:MAG: RHS repeat-associated core domain-containing protein [Clostridia bacterium]|nr:RHS repeat-associated core domain-containing protein [Clostridia bacterium]